MTDSKNLLSKDIKVPAEIDTSFFYRKVTGSQQLLILLHGYKQTGEDIYNWLRPALPEDVNLFIPNGPYPVPIRQKDHYKMTYSWYFFDGRSGEFVRDMDLSLRTIEKQLESLNWLNKETKVLGFSQGGYFAPHISKVLKSIKWICGIGSRYRFEDFEKAFQFPIYSIHGTEDHIVEYENSKSSFNKMKDLGNQGKFISIEGLAHEINEDCLEQIRSLIAGEIDFA